MDCMNLQRSKGLGGCGDCYSCRGLIIGYMWRELYRSSILYSFNLSMGYPCKACVHAFSSSAAKLCFGILILLVLLQLEADLNEFAASVDSCS